jgi:hypothetical protein
MRKSIIVALFTLAATEVFASSYGLKPGLWETRLVKQVVDGQDRSAQIAGASSKIQQAMASMPPEQRARMEAMMKEHGGPAMGGNGTYKMCISAQEANRDRPVVDREGRCQPATVTRSGNHTTFTINCASNGTVTTGKGESTTSGDIITSQVDITTKKANGETHVMHNESEMKFLGSDCGDVKPLSLPDAPH